MKTLSLPAERYGLTVEQGPGWERTYRVANHRYWELIAKLKEDKLAGRIADGYAAPVLDRETREWVATVRQLREKMPLRWRIVGWSAMALGALAGIGTALWSIRDLLLIAGITAVVLALLALFISARQGKCTVIHVRH
jgi:hypothetical protein